MSVSSCKQGFQFSSKYIWWGRQDVDILDGQNAKGVDVYACVRTPLLEAPPAFIVRPQDLIIELGLQPLVGIASRFRHLINRKPIKKLLPLPKCDLCARFHLMYKFIQEVSSHLAGIATMFANHKVCRSMLLRP